MAEQKGTSMTGTASPRQWAHEVAPHPTGGNLFPNDRASSDLPSALAKYHAARAYGFWLAMEHYAGAADPGEMMGQAVRQLIPEYALASMWWQMACTDVVDVPALAVDVTDDLASPGVLGPNLATILEWAGVQPSSIRPYLVD